jgi:hypothetical protein
MIAAFSPHKGPFFSANIVKPDLCARTPHAVNHAASNAIDIHAGPARFGSARRLCSSWRRRATSARIWCTRGPRKSGSTISRSSPSPHRRRTDAVRPVATVTAPCGMRPCSAAHAAGPFRGSADYSRHCAVLTAAAPWCAPSVRTQMCDSDSIGNTRTCVVVCRAACTAIAT